MKRLIALVVFVASTVSAADLPQVEKMRGRGCPQLPPYIEFPYEYRFVAVPLRETVDMAAVLHSGGYYVAGPIELPRRGPLDQPCYAFFYQTSYPTGDHQCEPHD